MSIVTSHPAPIEPPRQRAKRRKGLNAMTDLQAWSATDNAASEDWRAPIYKAHYQPKLERVYDALGNPWRLVIRFVCKYNRPGHSPSYRDRLRNSDGTSNLIKAAETCDRRCGAVQLATGDANQPQPWTAARHYAMLAIRCARDHRPFASVVDPLHAEEVQMLRPGTLLPTAASISNYGRYLYEGASSNAALYLQSLPGALHLAVDGWTSPTSTSFLGIIILWEEGQTMWRAVLEFVRLTKSHTGGYMAEQIEDCLERYGIKNKILTLCADNASNNNTLVRQLSNRIPSFRGPQDRIRCIAHILNLMCKARDFQGTCSLHLGHSWLKQAFTSLFLPALGQSNAAAGSDEEELDMEFDDAPGDADPGKYQHDQTVVQGVAGEALRIMAASGLNVSSAELASARKLIPKVAGLVRRINDSPQLETLFCELIDKDPELQGDMRALARYVTTRWNTVLSMLKSYGHFRGPIQYLTGHARYKVSRWALDPEQWTIIEQLKLVLEIFKEPTDQMSQSGVPLVSEVVPELLTVRDRLYDVRDDTMSQDLHPIVRIAAEASLLVFEKYMGLTLEESDVHVIAIVMCPNRKLKWYTDRSYEVDSVRSRVVSRFKELYPTTAHEVPPQNNTQHTGNIFLQRHSSSLTPFVAPDIDTIQAYLDSPVVSHDVLTQHGGVIPYWNHELSRRPHLARMALNYLTAPASSVDAERAFSSGRLTINHLQHQMSTRTFQAQMAVGSWFGTPFLPDIDYAASILEARM